MKNENLKAWQTEESQYCHSVCSLVELWSLVLAIWSLLSNTLHFKAEMNHLCSEQGYSVAAFPGPRATGFIKGKIKFGFPAISTSKSHSRLPRMRVQKASENTAVESRLHQQSLPGDRDFTGMATRHFSLAFIAKLPLGRWGMTPWQVAAYHFLNRNHYFHGNSECIMYPRPLGHFGISDG